MSTSCSYTIVYFLSYIYQYYIIKLKVWCIFPFSMLLSKYHTILQALVSYHILNLLEIRNSPSFVRRPLEPLVISSHDRSKSNNKQVLCSTLLPLIRLWLRAPIQKLHHILCLLRDSRRSPIFIIHSTIIQRGRHGNGSSREVWVVVETWHHRFASRCVAVPSQETEEVVLTRVSGFDHESEIRRQCSTIGRTTLFFVGIRGRERIIEFTRTFEHFTFVIRSIDDIDLGGHLDQFVQGVSDAY